MWDHSLRTVLGALDGLALRTEVRADNVANAQTPGFRAAHVDFESTLRDALGRGAPVQRAEFEVAVAPTVVDAHGNSVDLETELIGAMRDGLLRDSLVAAFNFKAGQLRAAIAGQR